MESVEMEVTELCLALSGTDDEEMLGLSESKLERDDGWNWLKCIPLKESDTPECIMRVSNLLSVVEDGSCKFCGEMVFIGGSMDGRPVPRMSKFKAPGVIRACISLGFQPA